MAKFSMEKVLNTISGQQTTYKSWENCLQPRVERLNMCNIQKPPMK